MMCGGQEDVVGKLLAVKFKFKFTPRRSDSVGTAGAGDRRRHCFALFSLFSLFARVVVLRAATCAVDTEQLQTSTKQQ